MAHSSSKLSAKLRIFLSHPATDSVGQPVHKKPPDKLLQLVFPSPRLHKSSEIPRVPPRPLIHNGCLNSVARDKLLMTVYLIISVELVKVF